MCCCFSFVAGAVFYRSHMPVDDWLEIDQVITIFHNTDNILKLGNFRKIIFVHFLELQKFVLKKAIPEKTLQSEMETDADKLLYKLLVTSCSG